MSDSEEGSSEERKCPVCAEHDIAEHVAAQGLILTGVRALFEADDETIRAVRDSMTQYDAHVAVSLVAAFLHDLAVITGSDLDLVLNNYRANLNAAQAEAD